MLGCVVTLGAALAQAPAFASAAEAHHFLFSFREVAAGAAVSGPIAEPRSITVDAGHLWLAETGSRFTSNGQGEVTETSVFAVDEFDASSGAFIAQPVHAEGGESNFQAIAIGHATGEPELYLGESTPATGSVRVLTEAGAAQGVWTGVDTPAKSFGRLAPGALAVDGSSSVSDWAAGDVYVADPANRVVDVFKPEAGGKEKYVTQLTGPAPGEEFGLPEAVAVNSATGAVIVKDSGAADLFQPGPLPGQYEFVKTLAPPAPVTFSAEALGANDGEGDVYLAGRVTENAQRQGRQVLEFNASGAYVGRVSSADVPEGAFEPHALAADPASHHLFVVDKSFEEAKVDAFGANLVIPDVTSEPAAAVGPRSATLQGTVTPHESGAATCSFSWGASEALGRSAPCAAPVPPGETPVAVAAPVAGLEPDTTYFYRLQATNANGTNPGEPWQDQRFTTAGPGLHGEGVAGVKADSATFQAKIDPHGAPTSYYFQYGVSTGYGATLPAPPGATLGAGEGDLEVTQHAQGLSPATIYHYRLVVISETAGTTETYFGSDQTFSTQPAAAESQLPDGRQWEMVSPPSKEGALLGWISEGLIQAAASGNAIADWSSFEPIEAGAEGTYGFFVQNYFGRGAHGWISKTITPQHSGAGKPPIGNGSEYHFFSQDLSKAILQPFGPATPLAPGVTEATPYLRSDFLNGDPGEVCASNCYRPLVDSANTPPGTKYGEEPSTGCQDICGAKVVGATPDLSHVVLKAKLALTNDGAENGLYEWSGGSLALVGLLPQGEHNEAGGQIPPGLSLGSRPDAFQVAHAISDDGSRIIFTSGRKVLSPSWLYARDTVKGETVRLNLPQGAPPISERNSNTTFYDASADGSRVFFTSEAPLTAGAKAEDLYEYNFTLPLGSRLTDLTVDNHAHESASVSRVTGVSEDGSYVYFTASGALTPGAPSGECPIGKIEKTGLCNLYVRHAGATTLIASLSAEDFADWNREPMRLAARVSPNGRWLAFMSDRNLVGYDTTDAVSGRPDEEVYLYDAVANKLVCASCRPSGARPVGTEYVSSPESIAFASALFEAHKQWVAANVPPWTRYATGFANYQSRYLSDSGRLFFDSHDALVPQDVNGTQDVYQYEPAGVGDCSASQATFSQRSGGCVGLISSGTSNHESAFLDASESGGDVFFLTLSQLAPQDTDNTYDIYDAHECSAASPCITAPASVPPCSTGDSCKPAATPQPEIFGAPASTTFSGAGNPPPQAALPTAPKSLTRAQQLARALAACRHKRRKQRVACERKARARYAPRHAHARVRRTRGAR